MVVHDLDQGCVIETSLGNPLWKLGVPDKCVAVNLLLVLLCIGSNGVSTCEGVLTTSWLSRLPFHGVLRGDGAKIVVIINDCPLCCINWVADSQGSTNEGAALSNDGCMKAS